MNDKDLEEYLIDCVVNDENGDMLITKIQELFMRKDVKLARYDYTLYILNESLECDRETIKELIANGEDGIYVSYLKGRVNGYEEAIASLTSMT